MPRKPTGNSPLPAPAAAAAKSKGLLSSTAMMLSAAVGLYTSTKDQLRTINKQAPSQEARAIFTDKIRVLIDKMYINPSIRKKVLEAVHKARTAEELSRTLDVLNVLNAHGLKREAANQFFLGGHFRIADGGKLYLDLNALKGVEARFSSHFPHSRVEERGISAGRILPEVLFLTTIEGGKTYSHFQAEASPWRQVPGGGVKNYIPCLQTLQTMEHVYDSLIYFSAKKISQIRSKTVYNRSSYGWSPYADNNPITSMDRLPSPHTERADDLVRLLGLPVAGAQKEAVAERKPASRVHRGIAP